MLRCSNSRNRRPDDLQGFITLEEFMLSQREDRRQITRNRSVSPRMTPLTSDHVHVQHRNFHDNGTANTEAAANNDVPYTRSKTNDEVANNTTSSYGYLRNIDSSHAARQLSGDFDPERNENKGESSKFSVHKKSSEFNCAHKKKTQDGLSSRQVKSYDSTHSRNVTNDQKRSTSLYHNTSDIDERFDRHASTVGEYNTNACAYQAQPSNSNETSRVYDYYSSKKTNSFTDDIKSLPKRLARNDGKFYAEMLVFVKKLQQIYISGCSGSSSDLTYHASYETLQRAKKDASVSRKGSFNLTNRRDYGPSDKHWLDSLRRTDKKDVDYDKTRLKNAAQYQPPPIPSSPFEQEGMTAAFEMHLDKGEQVQKPSRLRNLFGNKYQQKPCTLDLPKETQKTLLGEYDCLRFIFQCCASYTNLNIRFQDRRDCTEPFFERNVTTSPDYPADRTAKAPATVESANLLARSVEIALKRSVRVSVQ